ncbi:hAD hydrolase family IA variant 3 [Amedibacillus dolichus CAG:375]|uniref:HAD hydrolase family IA variant 3 n=1 Tax=Amedibacillus dolichus CAG:375 TaxID=1263076 RepID=R7G9Z4_9FIRM|nr:HAD family phosphatase [Amedibacillus dolichus]CDE22767.1 hAD hydrolase family IA variant 3 [Amedibacillus dolichus CAG:375]
MINAVIFDMDGVLFDTELVFDQIWTMLAKKYGYVIQQQMLNNLRGTSGKRMANIIESYWKDADGFLIIDEFFANAKAYLSQKVPLKPGVCELIDFLWQHKMPMAVASGSFKDLVLSNLKVSGLIHYFQVISSGDEVSSGKPEPDIFLLTAKRLCQKPQNVLQHFKPGYPIIPSKWKGSRLP